MKSCPSCGAQLRDEAVFCSTCGTSIGGNKANESYDIPVTTVPLITLAPQENTLSKQRVVRYGKMIAAVVLVIALALGAAAGAAWMQSKPFQSSSIESVDNDSYRKCLSLVTDVRNDNFDSIVEDLVNMSGDAENYNFLAEYERLFKEIIPEEPAEGEDAEAHKSAVKFRNCCFMVSYTEFQAKRYENLADKALIGALYRKQADLYRTYADELWMMLENADEQKLDEIINYCADRDIITLKNQE